MWDEYLRIVQEKNPQVADVINRYNGEILTNEDRKSQEMLYSMMNTYDGLNQITESGCYQIYNKEAGMWQNMRVTVDQNTGAITGIYNEATGRWAGYTEQMGKDAQKMAAQQDGAYTKIGASMGLYVNRVGQIVDANGQAVASLNELEAESDGTRSGIVKINNTPYKIKVNKDGTISALQAISEKADDAAKTRNLRINVFAEGLASTISSITNKVRAARQFNGIDNVPYDGYQAILHKGERVLTAEENKEYSTPQQQMSRNEVRSIVRGEISKIVIELNGREVGRSKLRSI